MLQHISANSRIASFSSWSSDAMPLKRRGVIALAELSCGVLELVGMRGHCGCPLADALSLKFMIVRIVERVNA
jgi:hypothetical protein